MTAELIRFWSTELIITSPQKPCRSLFQPAPPPTPSTSRLWVKPKMAEIRSFQDRYETRQKSVDYQTWLETDLSGRMARRHYSSDSLIALFRLWSLPPRSCGRGRSRRRSTRPPIYQLRGSKRMNSGLLSFWFNLDFALWRNFIWSSVNWAVQILCKLSLFLFMCK